MKISIIIPTLNEENYLPDLLKDIKKQDFSDYEIIVADAGSSDNTVKIAKSYGAKVVKGGAPAVGRNRGAKVASGEFLFFLDADVRLPKNFLKNAYCEMRKRYLDLATCPFRAISNLLIDKIIFNIASLLMKLAQFSVPHAPGSSIFVTKRLFERVGGFNERLKQAEDHDFVKRASRFRPLRVLESTYVKVSTRRLDKEGRILLGKKYLQVELYRLFKGEVDKELFEYEFGNYNPQTNKGLEKRLARIEKQLRMIDKAYKNLAKNLNRDEIKERYKKNLNRLGRRLNQVRKFLKESFK